MVLNYSWSLLQFYAFFSRIVESVHQGNSDLWKLNIYEAQFQLSWVWPSSATGCFLVFFRWACPTSICEFSGCGCGCGKKLIHSKIKTVEHFHLSSWIPTLVLLFVKLNSSSLYDLICNWGDTIFALNYPHTRIPPLSVYY